MTLKGKYAENKVREKLKEMEAAGCAFHRFPDAMAGSLVTSPSDFMVMKEGRLILLEVKEVNHAYRLPLKNYSPDQMARMRMWEAAGAKALVVIYFTPLRAWRWVTTQDLFESKQVLLSQPKPGGSWNFSQTPATTLTHVFEEIEW